jgi:hypothetical protein
MAYGKLIVALSMFAAASPLAATQPEELPMIGAPAAGPDARYCMRVELTGNVVEPVRCWTREKWAEQGVDVDKEWAREGIRVIA